MFQLFPSLINIEHNSDITYIFEAFLFASSQSKGFYGRKKIKFFMNNPNSFGLFLELKSHWKYFYKDLLVWH